MSCEGFRIWNADIIIYPAIRRGSSATVRVVEETSAISRVLPGH